MIHPSSGLPAGERRYRDHSLQTSMVTFCVRSAVHELISRKVSRTSFCAENIEFMRGMYDADKSGDTDMIRMRGSGALTAAGARFAATVAD